MLALVGLIAGQQLLSIGAEGRAYRLLQDALHAPWFFVVVLVLCLLGRRIPAVPRLLLVTLFGGALAVATEYAQTYVGDRSASVADLQRNLVGGGLGLLFSLLVIPWRPTWWKVLLGLLIGAALLAYAALPLWQHAQLNAWRAQLAPALLDPADARSERFLSTTRDTRFARGRAQGRWPAFEGRSVLHLTFGATDYPTLYVQDLNQRWQAYDTLVLELFVLGDAPLPLVAAVQYAGATGTSAYREFSAEPGAQRIEVPRRALVPDAASNVQVRDFLLYSRGDQAGRALLLGALYLE